MNTNHARHSRFLATLVGASLALFVTACSDSPSPAPTGAPSGPAVGGGGGAAPVADASIRLAGVVELHGAAANPPAEANLFVSVKPREGEFQRMPALSLKIDLAEFSAVALEGGVRRIPFEITGANTMAGGPPLAAASLPSPIDVEALYDPVGGMRDQAQLVRARLPVDGPIATDLVIVLSAP